MTNTIALGVGGMLAALVLGTGQAQADPTPPPDPMPDAPCGLSIGPTPNIPPPMLRFKACGGAGGLAPAPAP